MRRERLSWCLFDFANSAFNTVVLTFVYAIYFADGLAGDAGGQSLWGYSLALAGVSIAVLSPVLGNFADRTRTRRRFLIGLSLVSIVCTAGLFFPRQAGDSTTIVIALSLFTIANIAFELSFALYNSFLPGLGEDENVGKLSGYGWALGYCGGLLCLVISLGMLSWLAPAEPELADAAARSLPVRATNLLVAGWFLVFALPMFLFVREPHVEADRTYRGVNSLRAVWLTLRGLKAYPDLLRLFVARLLYNDGIMAIIGLAALYMADTLGMSTEEVIPVAIWLNVAAGLGALFFGRVDDRVGGKRVVVGSLVLLIVGICLAFAVPTVSAFWVAATLIGIGLGPNQSASRTLVARMIAPSRAAEFYGLFALSGKATVWIGPLLFAAIRPHVEDQRLALLPVVVLLVIGFLIVLPLDESRGIERARADG